MTPNNSLTFFMLSRPFFFPIPIFPNLKARVEAVWKTDPFGRESTFFVLNKFSLLKKKN